MASGAWWKLWKAEKPALQKAGYHPSKHDSGQWEVLHWADPVPDDQDAGDSQAVAPGMETAPADAAVLAGTPEGSVELVDGTGPTLVLKCGDVTGRVPRSLVDWIPPDDEWTGEGEDPIPF